MSRISLFLASALGLAGAAACGAKGPFPAGDPMRPTPREVTETAAVEEEPAPTPTGPTDCQPVDPGSSPLPPVAYKEREIERAREIALESRKLLFAAEKDSTPDAEKTKLVDGAIEGFQRALRADPYNPMATYNLAAAYGRTGKNQCALNLLARLSALHSWPSLKKDIDGHASYLFGRDKDGKPDVDFDRIRDTEDFKRATAGLK